MLNSYWLLTVEALQLDEQSAQVIYNHLMELYARPERVYHSKNHLLQLFQEYQTAQEAGALESLPIGILLWAIWHHDAVYDPARQDNELLSAQLAKDHAILMGLPDSVVQEVGHWIEATAYFSSPSQIYPAYWNWLFDFDLAILGQEDHQFWQYERQIRMEYHHLSEQAYEQLRIEMAKQFLAKPKIYQTTYGSSRYEQQARLNLANLIQYMNGKV